MSNVNYVSHENLEYFKDKMKSWIENQGYITSSALSGYATETWVGQQGYITGISSSDVTTALGYTPYNSTNPDGFISGITSSDVTDALGYTPPTADTWRPLGTGSNDACAGNDARLSDSRPASDVYSWAKASSKPSYAFNEINQGNITMSNGSNCFLYRTAKTDSYNLRSGFYYSTPGDESVVFANNHSTIGWLFVNGVDPTDMPAWNNLGKTPVMHIKKGGVAINKLIGQSESPSYTLDVNGSFRAGTLEIAHNDEINATGSGQNIWIGSRQAAYVDIGMDNSNTPELRIHGVTTHSSSVAMNGQRIQLDTAETFLETRLNFSDTVTGKFTDISMPGGAAPILLQCYKTNDGDFGGLYISEDNAFVVNSSDNCYTFAVFDKDRTRNFSTDETASFVVCSNGTGCKINNQYITAVGSWDGTTLSLVTS